MSGKIWLVLALLGALATGCGRQEPTRPAAQNSETKPAGQLARDDDSSRRHESQQLLDQWQRVATDVQRSVDRTQADLEAVARREQQEMAEFAARMAEDAKDRALDIPDLLDEFFGSSPSRRRDGARGERDARGPRR